MVFGRKFFKHWAKFGVSGAGVRVCVIDSPIFDEHEDLKHVIVKEGSSQIPYMVAAHGLSVAGMIKASNNEVGIVGTAPEIILSHKSNLNMPADIFRADPLYNTIIHTSFGDTQDL